MRQSLSRSRCGFSTAECVAIGGIVCVAGIAALTMLGQVSGNSFATIANGTPKIITRPPASSLVNLAASSSANASATASDSASRPLLDTANATTFSSSISTAIDASGANGATTMLAD